MNTFSPVAMNTFPSQQEAECDWTKGIHIVKKRSTWQQKFMDEQLPNNANILIRQQRFIPIVDYYHFYSTRLFIIASSIIYALLAARRSCMDLKT